LKHPNVSKLVTRFPKYALLLFASLSLLAVLAAAGGYLWMRGSLPITEGTVQVAGLDAPVEITRDPHGIPHIYAETDTDALFGLGYAHAQDRLWQMEMNRRTGAGRLSEIVGAAALSTDKFLRTLGVYRVVEEAWPTYEAEVRGVFDAYTAGVNAYLETRTGPLPPEFVILGHTPEPWRPEDSLVWLKMMAWDLGQNFHEELTRARLASRLSPTQIAEFLPPYPGEGPNLIDNLPQLAKLYNRAKVTQLAQALPEAPPTGIGSNNWVIDGSRTGTGKPLLANDPHLGLSAPSVWYFAHMSVAGRNVIGATLPGVPAVVLGRNDRIAWGFTNTGPDVQDLFMEKLDPQKPGHYQSPAGSLEFATRREVIRVKDAPDVPITVRESRHGPVISDATDLGIPDDIVMALAWTALLPGDRTPASATKMMRAENWGDFVEALRDYHLPQQNIVYADVDGNIGYYAPGKVPIRHPSNTLRGLAPAPGWDPTYDWIGFIPFEGLPQRYNPAGGVIATANHKIVSDDYPYFITSGWAKPYRARRIKTLLGTEKRHSIDTFKTIQADVRSVVVRDLLPLMIGLAQDQSDAGYVLSRLRAWDGTMSAGAAEPLIFAAWYRQLTRHIYQDELGDLFAGLWKMRPLFVRNVLSDESGQSRWCDDGTTDQIESCASQVSAALDAAIAELQAEHGSDMANWHWGEAHTAYSAHQPFGRHPWLSKVFDISVPSPGGSYTVNAGVHRIKNQAPYRNTHSASLRAIYDLSDLDKSVFIHSTGQSGNRMSSQYDNFSTSWSHNKYLPMTTDRATLAANAVGTLRLRPATASEKAAP
jgi:penicillin G amidase